MIRASKGNRLKGVLGGTTTRRTGLDRLQPCLGELDHFRSWTETQVHRTPCFVRVMSWYDNEWGFSNRMADTAVAIGKLA